MATKRLIIMDFDGTIVASDGVWDDVYLEYCALKDTQPLESLIGLRGRAPFENWILSIRNGHNASDDYQTVLSDMYDVAARLYCSIRPKDGFASFIEAHKNDEILIASREEVRLIDSYLTYWEVNKVFSIQQDKDNGRVNALFYERCAVNAGCEVSDLVCVDDSLEHCVAAKACGAFVVGVNDGHTMSRQMQMRPVCDLYINNFNELSCL